MEEIEDEIFEQNDNFKAALDRMMEKSKPYNFVMFNLHTANGPTAEKKCSLCSQGIKCPEHKLEHSNTVMIEDHVHGHHDKKRASTLFEK